MAEEATELDQFLEMSEEESTEPETPEDKETEEAEAKEEDSEDKGEQDAETPAAEKDESTAKSDPEKDWTYSAYKDEREKRQEKEREVEELRDRIARLEGSKEHSEEGVNNSEAPDMFADPEGYQEYQDRKLKQFRYEIRAEVTKEAMIESKGDDYLEKEKYFLEEMLPQDQTLRIKLGQANNPAKFVYEAAKKHQLQKEIGDDPDAYEAKVRNKLLQDDSFKAELLKELKGDSQEEKPDSPSSTPSLATASAAKSNNIEPEPDLEDMFTR